MRNLVNSSLFLYVLLLSATAFGNPDWQAPVIEPTVTTVVESHFGAIGGLIVDQLGYIYVADFWETVWRVDPNVPEVEAWAVGFYGSSGNTLDEHGNLYQSSFYGNYVSRISRRGEVSIVVDENLNGPVGLVFGEAEELYICSCNDRTIKKADADGNVTVFATSEHFNCPNGITKDS